jgi:hypothetical protein
MTSGEKTLSGPIILLLTMASCCGVVPWWNIDYVHVDHAQILYHARAWHEGRFPYRDDWLHHFCGYVVPVYVLGFILPIGPGLLKGLCITLKLLTAVINAKAAHLLAGKKAGVLAAFLTVSMGMFFAWQGNILNAQGFQEPLLALTLYFALRAALAGDRRSLSMAALLESVLILCDQRALLFAPVLVLPCFLHQQLRTGRTVLQAILSGIIVPCIGLVFLWWHNALTPFLEQTIVFPSLYRNQGVDQFGSIWTSAFERLRIFALLERPAVMLGCCGAVAIALIEKRRFVKWLFSYGAAAAIAYMLVGGRLYTNYALIISPILVLAAALLPAYMANRYSPQAAAIAYAVTMTTGLVAWAPPFMSMARGQTVYFSGDESVARDVASVVKHETPASSGLLVWGYKPQVFLHADRLSWFRDVSLISVGGANFRAAGSQDQGIEPGMLAEFQKQLRESPPDIIVHYQKKPVTPRGRYVFGRGEIQENMDFRKVDHLKFFAETIDRDYTSWKVFESPIERAEIYRRRQPDSTM